MKNNYKLGALLAIVGILAGILTLYFLADTYNTVIHTHFGAGLVHFALPCCGDS